MLALASTFAFSRLSACTRLLLPAAWDASPVGGSTSNSPADTQLMLILFAASHSSTNACAGLACKYLYIPRTTWSHPSPTTVDGSLRSWKFSTFFFTQSTVMDAKLARRSCSEVIFDNFFVRFKTEKEFSAQLLVATRIVMSFRTINARHHECFLL